MSSVDDAAVDSLHGWLLVSLAVATLVVLWGFVFTFTVYADSLAASFGLNGLEVSSVFSVTTAAFLVAGGSIGILIARMRLRPVVTLAGIVIAVAIVLLQFVTGYLGLMTAFALLGAASGTVFIVLISLVPLWFDVYEGRAMGVTLTGNGLGVLVLPFVWDRLLGGFSVRLSLAMVGGLGALLVLATSRLARRPPGLEPEVSGGLDRDWLVSSFHDAGFLLAIVGFPLLWSWYFVLSADLVNILTSDGIRRSLATAAFGMIGGISIFSRLGAGVVADRLGARPTLIAGVGLAALGVLGLASRVTPVSMYASLIVFGVGLGAIPTLYPPIIIDRFGVEQATAVVGVFTVAEATMAFLAPIGLSLLVTVTGGYTTPLVLLAAITILGAVLFYRGTRPAG